MHQIRHEEKTHSCWNKLLESKDKYLFYIKRSTRSPKPVEIALLSLCQRDDD